MTDIASRVIDTGSFAVRVDNACSGIEGAGLMLVFCTAWLWCFRRDYRFPNALVLIPAGIAAAWVLNGVRIAALVLIGNAGAPSVAAGGFHSQAGWIAFTASALGLALGARYLPWFSRNERDRVSSTPENNPTTAYLLPFLTILIVAMIGRASSGGVLDWLYPLRFIVVGGVIWRFRHFYRKLDWHFGWTAPIAGTAVFILWLALESGNNSGSALRSALQSWSAAGMGVWLIFRVAASSITVPVAEELAFRGFLIRRLMKRDFEVLGSRSYTWISLAGSSLAFGLMHGDRWIAGTIAGLVYAAAYLRFGRVGDAVMAHATTNALIAIAVVAGGAWNLWA